MLIDPNKLNHRPPEGGGFGSRLKARLGTPTLPITHPEIIIILRQLLRPDGLHDHLVRHVTRTRHQAAPRPKGPTPALLVQVAILLQLPSRTLPLHPLHQVTRRNVRRAGDEQVDVGDAHVTLEDLDLQLRTDRPNDLAEPDADFALEKLLAVFRDPHQVELDVELGVSGPSVVLHHPNVLEVVA
jgi:hypothetical protein